MAEEVQAESKILKPLMRAAGFVAYFAITLEMIFMATPFALYYYSAYSPFLSAASSVRGLAWLPAFFLPHLSTEIVPSIGGLIVLVGISGFLIGAVQIYYAKFRKRGVVKSRFYKRVRHPQYLFLGIAGLGLLIVWPRFVLLVLFVNVLWFYYLLARNEEERMRLRYGDAYLKPMECAPMFMPGDPGGRLAQLLVGWISGRKLRLFVLYCMSLVGAVFLAFALRAVSLAATTHLTLPVQKIAAVSFLPGGETRLRGLIESARSNREIEVRLDQEQDWRLIQAVSTKASATHVLIDAGMPIRQVRALPLATNGIKLVLLRREDQGNQEQPFEIKARWRPFLIAELDETSSPRLIDLPSKFFVGNPVMPIF